MNKEDKLIKIKIEDHSYSRKDLEDMKRWEDEGGTTKGNGFASSVKPPVKPGQIFEVLEGEIIYENGELYYMTKLSLLALY